MYSFLSGKINKITMNDSEALTISTSVANYNSIDTGPRINKKNRYKTAVGLGFSEHNVM